MSRPLTSDEARVWRAIRTDEPRTIAWLATLTGFARRDVEQALEGLRSPDVAEPIVAGARGVWSAATPEELRDYMAQYDRRLRAMFRTRRGLKLALRRMYDERAGQGRLWRDVA